MVSKETPVLTNSMLAGGNNDGFYIFKTYPGGCTRQDF